MGSEGSLKRKQLRIFMSDSPSFNSAISNNQPRLIWYQLVDSSTGQPYKATSAAKVSVPSNADVDDF